MRLSGLVDRAQHGSFTTLGVLLSNCAHNLRVVAQSSTIVDLSLATAPKYSAQVSTIQFIMVDCRQIVANAAQAFLPDP